jgi:hypothetical protein
MLIFRIDANGDVDNASSHERHVSHMCLALRLRGSLHYAYSWR